MTLSATPWPIESDHHPLGSLERQREIDGPIQHQIDALRTDTGLKAFLCEQQVADSPQAFLDFCFSYPQVLRDIILNHVRVEPKETFRGKGTFYAWINKACPVGCDFCFFRSPSRAQTEIPSGEEGIGKLIRFVNDGNMERLFVSGGGEPMLKKDDVNKIVREINVDRMILVTSAYFAATPSGALKAVSELRESLAQNQAGTVLTLRLSLDEGHLEKLGSRGRGFNYVHNLIGALQETALDEGDRLSFLIHTIDGDQTVEALLAELPVTTREDSGPAFKRRTRITLESGFQFTIEYAQLFQSNTDVDMNGEEAAHNIVAFKDYVEHRAAGNMTLHHNAHAQDHDARPNGVDWLVFYDGRATHWSSTVPDNETSIYGSTFDQAMQRHLDDVIALALLEKGTFYRDDLVAEANPTAVSRARAIGLRDQYPRVLLEEEGTRLYTSLRVIQDYIEEGRIAPEQVQSWPIALQQLVAIPREILVEACRRSEHDIVAQYLRDPEVSIEKLRALYKMVRLGHYDIQPVMMIERVLSSLSIDFSLKSQFAACIWGCSSATPVTNRFTDPTALVHSYHGVAEPILPV